MIGVYYSPESLTKATYEEVGRRLEAAGSPTKGMRMHTCFGEEGALSVFEVWETQADYEGEKAFLDPILEELGVKFSRPADIVPIVTFDAP